MTANKILWTLFLVYSVWPDDGPRTVECFPKNHFKIISGEYKAFTQFGDQIQAEYERLNPDGSISRSVAYGNPKEGLEYENYEIDPLGNVLNLDSPQTVDRLNDRSRDYSREDTLPQWRTEDQERYRPKFKTPKLKHSLKHFFEHLFD